MVANNGSEKPKATGTKRAKRIDKKLIYCRCCQETKSESHFYSATDRILDANQFMSVCKDCISQLYINAFSAEHTLERAMLYVCRLLNWKYDENAINAVKTQLANKNASPDDGSIPGIYKSRLVSVQPQEIGKRDKDVDLTFHEPTMAVLETTILNDTNEASQDLRIFWGKSFIFEDLEFLQNSYNEWCKSHKIETQSEKKLLKFICIKELEIEKELVKQHSVSALVKEYQDLLKTSALSPNMVNANSSGKNLEAFGVWIQEIERLSPAEWWEQQELFRDVDNIDEYGQKYITEPLRRFVTGSRDFTTDEVSEMLEKEDSDVNIDLDIGEE